MRRFIHGLLVALLVIGSVSATTYTDKTFLKPRSNGMNLAMEKTTWHQQVALIDKHKFGGTVQATGFYEESKHSHDLGTYFGTSNWRNNGGIAENFITVIPDEVAGAPLPWDFTASDVFVYGFSPRANLETLAQKITWNPHREAYGLVLDYHQKLDKLLKGLFIQVKLPIVHVKTSMDWSSTCSPVSQMLSNGSNALNGTAVTLAQYLTGDVVNNAVDAKQKALKKAKLHNGNSETAIADIDIKLGYNFLYKHDKQINANIAFTIPTGNDPSGEYLYPAIVGNNHWAIGGGLDLWFKMWHNNNRKATLDFLFACNYRYLLSDTEHRTLGFKWPHGAGLTAAHKAGKQAMYGFWELGARKGDTFATPMANFLTRDVKVTPGSNFDAITALAFNYGGWSFDLGYNMFAKEKEHLHLKGGDDHDRDVEDSWQDGTYAVIDAAWQTSNPFSSANIYDDITDWINKENLTLDTCTSPELITHKVYGGVGYAFNKWEYPVMFGLGGSWEFKRHNNAPETWALWGKIGVTF
jgi:hypothetical protein